MERAHPNEHQQEILARATDVLLEMGPPCEKCEQYHEIPPEHHDLLMDALSIAEEFGVAGVVVEFP